MPRPIVATDLMNPDVLTVAPEMSVQRLATFLVDNEISGAPVVKGDRLVGIVSLVDVAEATAGSLGAWGPGYQRGAPDGGGSVPQIEVGDEDLTVGDIMATGVETVEEDATVAEIHKLLQVVDRDLSDAQAEGLSADGRFQHAYLQDRPRDQYLKKSFK